MAYGVKYISEFRDLENNLYKISLLREDYTGASAEVMAASNPLSVSTPETEKFDPVKGTGAIINLLSSTDRQLIDLYTADYKGWKVEILKNNAVYFLGFVEPEMYEETFKRAFNYDVSVTTNNGIGVLERERYLKADGTNYRGGTTEFEVISNVISKIGLDYTHLNICTDVYVNDVIIDINKSILQRFTVNNDNFIDEDGVELNCREVLESILSPHSLSFFAIADQIWVVDFELLKGETINYKSFAIAAGVVADTCTNETLIVSKDLKSYSQLDSSFNIKAGFNFYILKKNRYVKEIIKKVDLSDEGNYTGDPNGNVLELKDNTIFTDNYTSVGTDRKLWIHKLTSFSDYDVNDSSVLPNNYRTYWTNGNIAIVAFCGGVKPQKFSDGILINYDVDDSDFDNYIFVNNPYDGYFDSIKVTDLLYLPRNHYQYNINDISRLAFKYTVKSPLVNNSLNTKIRLKFTSQIISSGLATSGGSNGEFKWRNVDTIFDGYGAFMYFAKVLFKDESGVVKYFVRLRGSESFNANGEIPFEKNAIYELVEYTGQAFDYCMIYLTDINEIGEESSILNKDIITNLDIPLGFDASYFLEIEFYNMFFKVTKFEVSGTTLIELPYYKPVSDFKESYPHIAFKNISTELVQSTGEPIGLEDEELQYSLSETYKTESKKQELTNFTADNKYVTDVAGITIDNDYITQASANGRIKENFEDLKGQKTIDEYENNQIVLSVKAVGSDINLLTLFKLEGDVIWGGKKWVIVGIEDEVRMNEVELTLEEIF